MVEMAVLTNDERIKRRLKAMVATAAPTIEHQLRATLGEDWLATARHDLGKPRLRLNDASGFLNILLWGWYTVFAARYPVEVRRLTLFVRDIRNDVGHDEEFGDADAARLMAAIGDLEALLCSQPVPALVQAPPPPRFAMPARAPWGPATAPRPAHSRSRQRRATARPVGRLLRIGFALLGTLVLFVACAGMASLRVTTGAGPGVAEIGGGAGRVTPTPSATRPATLATPEARECLPQTGQCIEGAFLVVWRATGGLRRHGAPLTGERQEVLADGRAYIVQYFERSRLERPVAGAGPVQAGTLGRLLHGLDPIAPQAADAHYFPATGHNVGGRFLAYWEANGGEAGLGLPLGEERRERLEDGRDYTVQWFERARLELHPEASVPDDVQLGQLGRLTLAR